MTTPTIGMGATSYGDIKQSAGTIVAVTADKIFFQLDIATLTDEEMQTYKYTPNPQAPIKIYQRSGYGWRCSGGEWLEIGERNHYRE